MLLAINWGVPEIVGMTIGCLIIACAFIIGLMFLLGFITFKNTFARPKVRTPEAHPLRSVLCPHGNEYAEKLEAAEKAFEEIPFEWISVQSEDGLKLSARYYKSEGAEKTVIGMHGFASNAVRDFALIAPHYLEKGYNVLLPAERGHGESEGQYTGLGVLESKDIKVWVSEIIKIAPGTEIFIHGISIGATAAALSVSDALPNAVKGIIVDSAFTRIWDVMCFQIKELYKLTPFPILHIAEVFSKRLLKMGFHRERTIESVRQAEAPMLFIHGGKDKLAPVYMCEALYNACTAPKAKFIAESAGYAEALMTETESYIAAVDEFMSDPAPKADETPKADEAPKANEAPKAETAEIGAAAESVEAAEEVTADEGAEGAE